MYHDSCVKRYPENGLEVIDKSYANHKRCVENLLSNSYDGKTPSNSYLEEVIDAHKF